VVKTGAQEKKSDGKARECSARTASGKQAHILQIFSLNEGTGGGRGSKSKKSDAGGQIGKIVVDKGEGEK